MNTRFEKQLESYKRNLIEYGKLRLEARNSRTDPICIEFDIYVNKGYPQDARKPSRLRKAEKAYARINRKDAWLLRKLKKQGEKLYHTVKVGDKGYLFGEVTVIEVRQGKITVQSNDENPDTMDAFDWFYFYKFEVYINRACD